MEMHSRDHFFQWIPPILRAEVTGARLRITWVHRGCKSACGRIDRAYVPTLRTNTGTGEGDVDVPIRTR